MLTISIKTGIEKQDKLLNWLWTKCELWAKNLNFLCTCLTVYDLSQKYKKVDS